MPHGKSSNQDQYLFNFIKAITGTKNQHKYNVIVAMDIDDVIKSQTQVHFELTHIFSYFYALIFRWVKIIKKYLISVLFVLSGISSVSAHPFYVSICQLYFNRETSALEIWVKIFTDDLANALEKEGHSQLYLGEAHEDPKTDSYLFQYLKKELTFQINGKQADYQFVGKESEDAVVWTYLEIKDVTELKSVQVNCKLLTGVFDTQNNMIQVEKDNKTKNLLLNKRETTGTVTF